MITKNDDISNPIAIKVIFDKVYSLQYCNESYVELMDLLTANSTLCTLVGIGPVYDYNNKVVFNISKDNTKIHGDLITNLTTNYKDFNKYKYLITNYEDFDKYKYRILILAINPIDKKVSYSILADMILDEISSSDTTTITFRYCSIYENTMYTRSLANKLLYKIIDNMSTYEYIGLYNNFLAIIKYGTNKDSTKYNVGKLDLVTKTTIHRFNNLIENCYDNSSIDFEYSTNKFKISISIDDEYAVSILNDMKKVIVLLKYREYRGFIDKKDRYYDFMYAHIDLKSEFISCEYKMIIGCEIINIYPTQGIIEFGFTSIHQSEEVDKIGKKLIE